MGYLKIAAFPSKFRLAIPLNCIPGPPCPTMAQFHHGLSTLGNCLYNNDLWLFIPRKSHNLPKSFKLHECSESCQPPFLPLFVQQEVLQHWRNGYVTVSGQILQSDKLKFKILWTPFYIFHNHCFCPHFET